MNRTPPPDGGRALVLGGGGSTGNAWLIGVVAGLAEAGVDVTTADLTIGTSAGATAAAQLAGAAPGELLAAILDPAPQTPPGPGSGGPAVADHLRRINDLIAASSDLADMRRRLGAAALAMDGDPDGSRSAMWRSTVAARLPGGRWPTQRAVLITAVDARSGAPVVFDSSSGVDLVDAVAASCASGFPYRIGPGRYLDGGSRSNPENADLAAGSAGVVVLSPLGGRSLTPVEWGSNLASQVDRLRADGSRVATIVPDRSAEQLFGANAMDLSLRPAAARAGYDQGAAMAEQMLDVWR